jgi:hypothetical protein
MQPEERENMNKKGTIDLSLQEIVVLIAVGVGIVLVLVPMLAHYLSGDSRGVDKGTKMSISYINEGIDNLVANLSVKECYFDFGIQDDLVFVGFSKQDAPVIDTATDRNWLARTWQWLPGTDNYNTIAKPDVCSGFACLALCDVGGFWDYGNNDAGLDSCINSPRIRPTLFDKVNKIRYMKADKEFDFVLYSNLFKLKAMKLIKKDSSIKDYYDIYITEYTKKESTTASGDAVPACSSIKNQNEIQ